MVADPAVVSHMAVGHQEGILPDDGFSESCGSFINSNTFTNDGTVADDHLGFFALVFKILGDGRNDGTREDLAACSDPRPVHQGSVGSYPGSLADLNILVYSGKCLNGGTFCHFGSWVY
jgi:hypothetical protein